MILTGQNRNTPRKIRPSDILSTVSPTWSDLGSNRSLRSDRSATKRLNHGTVNRNKNLRELYINIQSVPRNKHTPSLL